MPRPSPASKALSTIAKDLARAKPAKAFVVLFDALPLLVAAGDVASATTVAGWLFGGRLALPKMEPTVLALSAVDGFAAAAKLGDLTKGQITSAAPDKPLPLAKRVSAAEEAMRQRLLGNAYGAGGKGNWRGRKETDPFRRIGHWREIQTLASAKSTETNALELLAEYLDAWAPDDRGAGFGDELVLALDLELRLKKGARVAAWLERHGSRLVEPLLLQTALGLPPIAASMCRGAAAKAMCVEATEIKAAVAAFDRALAKAPTAVAPPVGAVQRRCVSAEYSQVHLEPETLAPAEKKQVYFQKKNESARGMSLFANRVAIATPTDTDHVDAIITVEPKASPSEDDAVQAVAFPLTVRGPLVLRSVASDANDDEPFLVPPGKYDVHAAFYAKKKAKNGLRTFELRLSFRPMKRRGAPKS